MHRLADPLAFERVQDLAEGREPGGLDQQPVGSTPEQRYERHLEHEPGAAADAVPRNLTDLYARASTQLVAALRHRSVQSHKPVLVDEHSPSLASGTVLEQVVERRRLGDSERTGDGIHRDALGRVIIHREPPVD